MQQLQTDLKIYMSHNEVHWKIPDMKNLLKQSGCSRAEAVIESRGMCFQLFVSSTRMERGEERMTGV